MTTRPTAPLRDFEKTVVAIISTTIAAATARRDRGCHRDIATIAAIGMKVTMFNARSFGLPKMPPTAPARRPPSTRLTPLA